MSLSLTAIPGPRGWMPDQVGSFIEAVISATGRLGSAVLARHDADAIAMAIAEAKRILQLSESLRDDLVASFAPAKLAEMELEIERLIRAWPQSKGGDLAGFGAELACLVIERRPTRRGLAQACRALKLGKVHLPAIAEVISAIDEAERPVRCGAEYLERLPGRIASAEALLAGRTANRPRLVAPREHPTGQPEERFEPA